jgi:tRNA/rRNA methyltransferase
MLPKPPVIILVRPQMGENIGATARAMKNFGLSDLRLVAPRDGWPNDKAVANASHATDIIAATRVYDSIAAAVADCHKVYGCSARRRDSDILHVSLSEASACVRGEAGQSAYLFGPENNGLSNEDISYCQALLTIPTGEYSSLNLAQSVIICAYDWFNHEAAHAPATMTGATLEEKHALYTMLVGKLEDKAYFPPNGKAVAMRHSLQALIERSPLSPASIKRIRSIIYSLSKP